jgi:hypothetical protein
MHDFGQQDGLTSFSYIQAFTMACTTFNAGSNPFDFDLVVKNGIVVTASVCASNVPAALSR